MAMYFVATFTVDIMSFITCLVVWIKVFVILGSMCRLVRLEQSFLTYTEAVIPSYVTWTNEI